MADELHSEHYDVNVGHDLQPGDPPVATIVVPPEENHHETHEAIEEDKAAQRKEEREEREGVDVVSHSDLFYWWPIWAVGYLFAAVTWFTGQAIAVGAAPPEMIHPNNSWGVIYIGVIFFVIVISNVSLRGLISGMVIVTSLFIAVLLAWLDLWDTVLRLIPHVNVHMSFGFYMVLSTLVFILWAASTFIFDRLTYWRVEAGQVRKEYLIGGGEESYDTTGLVLEERHDDLFRHWILGLGSGDLHMKVANKMHDLPNVLLANRKAARIQKLIKRKPD